MEAYWHIGRIVMEIEQADQERADYGIHLIESLSYQLTKAIHLTICQSLFAPFAEIITLRMLCYHRW